MTRQEASRPWWILPAGRIRPVWWLAVAPALIWLDYAAGADTQLPAVYVLPVCIAAWYSGQWPALAFAIAVPIAHVTFMLTLWRPPDLGWMIGIATLRATAIAFIALVFSRQSEHERWLRRNLEQQHALQLRAEQLRVVQVTMRTVQDIVNNCLNQLVALRLDAEGQVPAASLGQFDQALRDTTSQLKALADLQIYAEKQMAIGIGLDVAGAERPREQPDCSARPTACSDVFSPPKAGS
jgi:hypothetical protein